MYVCFRIGYNHYLHHTEKFTFLITMPFNISSISDLHLPDIDVSDYINRDKLHELQLNAERYWQVIKEWSIDYLLYMRMISYNIINGTRTLMD